MEVAFRVGLLLDGLRLKDFRLNLSGNDLGDGSAIFQQLEFKMLLEDIEN